ncbi:MAG: DUF460 domain-containing protein [Thermoprotei archaeon]
MRVLGLDIEPGKSPQGSVQPTYSIVILDEDKLLLKEEGVKLSRLIRLAWEYRPQVLALDNVFELGATERDVVKVVSMMPPEIRLVQVNLQDGKFEDLVEVAKRFSIDVPGKPRPIKTALINALLALKGSGTVISVYESKTKIVISKGKTTSKGGMSSNRYKRNIRATVLRVVKKVKEALDSNGFDYDYLVKKSRAGVEKAVFIVYAPRESLYGVVRKIDAPNVKLDIRPVYKSKLVFQDKKPPERKLIVGVDPGIETGVSIIDIYGNPVFFTSRRSIDRLDVIEIIRNYGKPLIIATDVNPPSDAVKKLVSQLGGVKLFYPERSMTIDEKTEIVQEYAELYGLKIDDPHVRDSLAAALKAYREVSKKVRQAESLLRKLELDIDEDSVISCVVSGKTVADCVEEQIEKNLERPQLEVKEPQRLNVVKEQGPPVELIREMEALKSRVKALIREKQELEERIAEMKAMFKAEVMKERKIYEMSERVKALAQRVAELERALADEAKRRENLESLIPLLIEGRKVVIREGEDGLLKLSNGRLFALEEEVNPRIADYVGRDFVIVDKSVLQDLQVLKKEKEASSKKGVEISDVKKLIEEYRKQRWG